MAIRTLEELISAASVFTGLSSAQLELIAGCGANEHFAAGERLFREGGPAERFFLIREGAVALEVDAPGRGPLVIETLHGGEVVGWSWLFEPYRWEFDARAVVPTAVVCFDGACLRGKCEEDHELGYQLMRRFASLLIDRLQATRLQLLDVYGHAPAG
ncbi:MAG TPA: cyclic nucleotide-binding domain-containing protein [Solirubrobacteraceae bacterium]|nr:cyclic nucleotide-binding domain-containing protein [Solirubrobacteraceae bacterium]